MKGRNNLDNICYGIMIKKTMCDEYNIDIDEETKKWFMTFYNPQLNLAVKKDVAEIMHLIPKKPVKFVSKLKEKAEVDFYLSNDKTMSIRMCKSGTVPPRVLGQAGKDTINFYYSDILDRKVENTENIREIYSNKKYLCAIIPRLIERLLWCDYNVFKLKNEIKLIKKFDDNIKLYPEKIEITASYNYPHIKYDGITIMEISYIRSTPNIRIKLNNIDLFLEKVKVTDKKFVRGKLGTATEKAICNIFGLNNNISYNNVELISRVTPYIERVFKNWNVIPTEYVGGIKGESKIEGIIKKTKEREDSYILRGIKGFGNRMSSPIDFFTSEELSISVKTTKNSSYLVCPDTIGQPTAKSCKELIKKIIVDFKEEITPKIFIDIIMDRCNLKSLINKYIEYLFLCKYLFYVAELKGDIKECLLICRDLVIEKVKKYKWNEEDFQYLKSKEKMLYDINESKTSNGHATLQIDYQGVRLGQFDILQRKNKYNKYYVYEFRFNIRNLLNILNIE